MLAHFLPFSVLDAGRLGVDIFFCLSGLLMSRILFVERVPLGRFYKRRISRIAPVFLLYVLTVYTFAFLTERSFAWKELVSTVLFLRTYIPATPDIWHSGLPLGHLWSLNVEEHSYVLMSLLALLAIRGREGAILVGLGLLALVMFVLYYKSPSWGVVLPEIRTETAAATLLLSAGYFLIKRGVSPHVRPWMPIAAFVGAVLCYSTVLPDWMRYLVSPFLLAFAVNHLDQTGRLVRAGLSAKPLRMLGLWSYSLYLWQQPFFAYKDKLTTGVAFVGAVLLGLCSYYLFEKPVRSWLNQNW